MRPLSRLVVCGTGLIGGSFALALKAGGQVADVVGIGRTRQSLQDALDLGIIDRIALSWQDALEGAELVFLGVPVAQTASVLSAMAPHLSGPTLLTDGGSTKHDVVAAARAALGKEIWRMIPGHPIAGSEKSGPHAARADLYRARRVVLTPLAENRAEDIERIRALWRACGARVSELGVGEHDRALAAVSHLPHLLSYALVGELARRDDVERLFDLAAGGFRDFTRIAGSHPEMWRDICLANRDALLAELDAYGDELARLRAMIVRGDAQGLFDAFAVARQARNAWVAKDDAGRQA
ncbi:MAG TPA: prephenate dehydrogenase/arogenate dehydrogenase family protein [Rhodocyclaceae bacterium]|nr:prephenate dehydrogenase/arogenate dehydrogenase family protein [Rhodocyclaceae bacterium]